MMTLNEADKVLLATWLMEIGTTQGVTHENMSKRQYPNTATAYYQTRCHYIKDLIDAGYLRGEEKGQFFLTQKALDELGVDDAD